jgi:hypothetical protein
MYVYTTVQLHTVFIHPRYPTVQLLPMVSAKAVSDANQYNNQSRKAVSDANGQDVFLTEEKNDNVLGFLISKVNIVYDYPIVSALVQKISIVPFLYNLIIYCFLNVRSS